MFYLLLTLYYYREYDTLQFTFINYMLKENILILINYISLIGIALLVYC